MKNKKQLGSAQFRSQLIQKGLKNMSSEEFRKRNFIGDLYQVLPERDMSENKLQLQFVIRPSPNCHQDCVSCPVDKTKNTYVSLDVIKDLLKKISKDFPEEKYLIFTGGETMTYPFYDELVSFALDLKTFQSVIVQTTGTTISLNKNYKKFSSQNLHYYISFHSFKEEIYHKFTRTKQQYSFAVEGIKAVLKNTDNKVTLNFLLNSMNFEDIEDHTNFVLKEFASIRPCKLTFTTMFSPFEKKNNLYVKHSDVIPKLVELDEKYKDSNLEIEFFTGRFISFPPCLLQSYPHYSPRYLSRVGRHSLQERKKIPECDQCIYNEYCIGLDKNYAKKFGVAELKAIKNT